MSQKPPAPEKSEFRFFHDLRVRWSEVDPQNIVFNPNYLIYADLGVSEYWRQLSLAYPWHGFDVDIFAVNTNLNFRGSAGYDDWISVGTRVARIGRSSMQFVIGIFREEQLLVDVSLTYVFADPKSRSPKAVPETFVEKIAAFEKTPVVRS